MATTAAPRYSITSARIMMATLEAWLEQSGETLSNEESKDYPNDERIDALTTRMDALQAAVDALDWLE